jgi:hypothetical protein
MRRAVLSRLPFVTLQSDVADVVYLTWAIPAAKAVRYVPKDVQLTERNGLVLFTILTYRHGHFGPALFGPFRALFPSPRQSNWRFYVESLNSVAQEERTILFVKNVLDDALYCCGSRLFSDALPSHLADTFTHEKTASGYRTEITSGAGSAPALKCEANFSKEGHLPASLRPFFSGWAEAVQFLCVQHAAVAIAEDVARLAHAGIDLPIAIESVVPLSVAADAFLSPFLEEIGAMDEPFCFVVPQVRFRVLWEKLL